MTASSATFVSTHPVCLSTRRNARYALAIGASALLLGGGALAADEPGSKSNVTPAAATTPAPDAATVPGVQQNAETAQTAQAAAAPSSRSDPPQKAGAKSRKSGKEHKSGATSDSAPTGAPTTTQVQIEERFCHLEQAPGSRVRKTVCTSAAEQNANAKDGQEYLKRAYEDSLHPTPNPSTFTGAR
jgi:hypothetical protein